MMLFLMPPSTAPVEITLCPTFMASSLPTLFLNSGVPPDLLQRYNPAMDFSAGSGILSVPARDEWMIM
ncbi:chitin elicitor receptor kinase 1 [Euphorbia peplus]|nr:chitin elicitor receptor kinase 1 [Euphorbia peplus]